MAIVLKRRGYYYERRLSGRTAEAMGKQKVSRSLKTDSRREAERLRPYMEAKVQREIDDAMAEHPDAVSREFFESRREYQNAKSQEERDEITLVLGDILEERDRRAARQKGLNPYDPADVESTDEHRLNRQGLQYVTGQLVRLTEHLDTYIARKADRVIPKTLDQYRADVGRIADEMPFVSDVTPSGIQAYADKRLTEGAAVKTIRRELSSGRGYWRWLSKRLDSIDQNARSPFDGVELDAPSKKRSTKREAYAASDAVRLLRAAVAKPDPVLADLIRLGMFTGARRAELCSMKISEVCLDTNVLKIRDAKTPAGNRDTPIHPKLRPVIERLVTDSTDGYLLSGLSREGKYGDRGNAIGKRFSKLKTRLGFGPNHVFHSFRNTLNTMLVNSGVPDAVVKDIVGHEQDGMTRGVYYDPKMTDQEESRRRIQRDAMKLTHYPGLEGEDMA